MIRQQGGFKETIKKAFPEADFTTWGTQIPQLFPKNILTELFWNLGADKPKPFQEISNCREAFLHYADEKGFDALQPENWYNIKSSEFGREVEVIFWDLFHHPTHTHQPKITTTQGAQKILSLHGGMKNALKLAFPEISFAKWGDNSFVRQ